MKINKSNSTQMPPIQHPSPELKKSSDEGRNTFEVSSQSPQSSSSQGETSQTSNSKTQTVLQTLLGFEDEASSVEAAESTNSLQMDGSSYEGRDLQITKGEEKSLGKKDLQGFWNSRLGKDPVARLGIALWGTLDDLEKGIDSLADKYWTPTANVITKVAMFFRAPSHVKTPPETRQERLDYWAWMGEVTNERVDDEIQKAHPHLSKQGRLDMIKEIGLDLATAHAAAVGKDHEQQTGEIPGLLDSQQIADYHHSVFGKYQLPKSTYGGTPHALVPDFLELSLADGLYAHDADH